MEVVIHQTSDGYGQHDAPGIYIYVSPYMLF